MNENILAQKIVASLNKMVDKAYAESSEDDFEYAYGVAMARDKVVLILLNEGIVL